MICNICPRKCNVDRDKNTGFCGMTNEIFVARAALHFWEEPCISGENGSGAVFFSGCNMGCVFCQNRQISTEHKGKTVSVERLAEIFLELLKKGAHNINLVTPTHYIVQIKAALKLAQKEGLNVPIIYNSSGYENPSAIDFIDDEVAVYLPDFKYMSENLAGKYSKAFDYPEVAKKAIDKMVRNKGKIKFDENDIIKSGVIVRHMILPGFASDSKRIIEYLYKTYGDDIYLSIMNQYTPIHMENYPEINKTVTEAEYDDVLNYAVKIGVENAFIQEGSAADESFIPDFDFTGV